MTSVASEYSGVDAPALVGLVGSVEGRRYVLVGSRLTLGRDGRCELVLEHSLVSREHAAFDCAPDGGVTITDLGSTQGTFVNGRRISQHVLRDGDHVGFGRDGVLSFRFEQLHHASRGASAPGAAATPATFSVDEIRTRLRAAGEAAVRVATPSMRSVVPDNTSERSEAASGLKRVGRAPDNDIVLNSPAVSRYHATIQFDSQHEPVVTDLSSTNGTFVNGELIRGARSVSRADLILVGGFILRINGNDISRYDLGSSRMVATQLSKEAGGRKILQDISFAVLPREFIGLMGPSGCGKSTLMDALNGLRPASAGSVFVDDLDLYKNFDAVRRSIGYVPQRDVLHDALTVERTLYYSAQLRLPEHTSDAEKQQIIDGVIQLVGLEEQRRVPFRQLSGGQQKRLSLAVELLTKPNFLFLDEPTSPLDPETSENLMLLFRRLADEGRIVIMVTHKFEQFEQMHQIALLTKGGRLAFFGPPREALRFFGCHEPAQMYREIGAKEPEQVAATFRRSGQYRAFVAERLSESEQAVAAVNAVNPNSSRDRRRPAASDGAIRQWGMLSRRYLEIKLNDRRNTLLLLAQAPFIALILALITGDTANDAKTLFIAAIIAIWFGANNAIREIIAEWPIYQRERLVNLRIAAYLLSKFCVLALIAICQCALFTGILVGLHRLHAADMGTLLPTLSLTAFGGIGLGLFFSALVNTTEKAMSVLPLLLIPQLLLSGFLKPIDNVYVNERTGHSTTAVEYQRFNDAHHGTLSAGIRGLPDPVRQIPGLGPGVYAADIMIGRWSVDALVHAVSRSDLEARERLAAQLYVAAHASESDEQDSQSTDARYLSRLWMDDAVLAAIVAVLLGCAAVSLRAKDTL